MKLVVDSQIQVSGTQIRLVHGDEEQLWNIKMFDDIAKKMSRYRSAEDDDSPLQEEMFREINDYWATLPPDVQSKIFDVYRRTRDVFYSAKNMETLTAELLDLVRELYQYHDLNDIRQWVAIDSGIVVPSHVEDDFWYDANEMIIRRERDEAAVLRAARMAKEPDEEEIDEETGEIINKKSQDDQDYAFLPEPVGTREKTYIYPDVKDLIALSIALRPMLVIWGEYIAVGWDDFGATWKEYFAFQLMAKTSLWKTYRDGEDTYEDPVSRLFIYVKAMAKQSTPEKERKMQQTAIHQGIGSEYFTEWLLAVLIVRRIAVADIRTQNPKKFVVAAMYRLITQKLNGKENTFSSSSLRAKTEIVSNGDDESNLSKLEAGSKVRQAVSTGNVVNAEYFIRDPYHVAKLICPSMPELYIDTALDAVTNRENDPIEDCQIRLFQWMLRSVMHVRGFTEEIDNEALLSAMTTTTALLWYGGHKELAGLASAVAIQEENNVFTLTGNESRARFPKEITDKINELWPYTQRVPGKKLDKTKNPTLRAISLLNDDFRKNEWHLSLPKAWLNEIAYYPNDRRYPVPVDIKVKLAEFSIYLIEGKYKCLDN